MSDVEPLVGRWIVGRSPLDPTGKMRPGIIIDWWDESGEMLVIFGQSFKSGEGDCFILEARDQPRYAIRHRSFFFADGIAIVCRRDCEMAAARLNRSDYEDIFKPFIAKQQSLVEKVSSESPGLNCLG